MSIEGNGVTNVLANIDLMLINFIWWYGVPQQAVRYYHRNLSLVLEYIFLYLYEVICTTTSLSIFLYIFYLLIN